MFYAALPLYFFFYCINTFPFTGTEGMLPWLKKESQQSTPVEKSWIKKLAAMFMFIINLALSTKALKFTMFYLLFLKYTISKTQGFVWKGKKSLVLLLIKLISNGFSWQFEFSLENFFSLVRVEQVSWVSGAGGRFGEPQLHRWTPVILIRNLIV